MNERWRRGRRKRRWFWRTGKADIGRGISSSLSRRGGVGNEGEVPTVTGFLLIYLTGERIRIRGSSSTDIDKEPWSVRYAVSVVDRELNNKGSHPAIRAPKLAHPSRSSYYRGNLNDDPQDSVLGSYNAHDVDGR